MNAEATFYSFRFVFFWNEYPSVPSASLCVVFGEVLEIVPQNLAVLAGETRTARLPFTLRLILC